MKKRIVIIVVVLLVLAAAVAGGWWAWVTYGDTATDEDILGGSGTVEADQVAISSMLAGRISAVETEEGSEVSSGTPLFTLDSEILRLQVEQADAGVKAAEAALAQVTADAGTPAEINAAQARVDQAEAALNMAEVQLSYARIFAPIDGTLTQITASVGENAAPGKTLATMVDLDMLYVDIYIPETRIGEISIGDRATATTDSSERDFDAEVIFIASEAEFTPSNIETREQRVKLVYQVRLSVEDSGAVLKPGMPVDVEF